MSANEDAVSSVAGQEVSQGLKPQDRNRKQPELKLKEAKLSSKVAQIKEESLEDEDRKDLAATATSGSSSNDASNEVKKKKWEPENWLEQFNLIRTMRSEWNAPVDTMGCDSNWDYESPPHVIFFHFI